MELYHGSTRIVKEPVFGKGNPLNDYGTGFYCTGSQALANEWACSEAGDGFINIYRLDLSQLSVMDLNGGGYNILNWLAILLDNRRPDLRVPVALQAKEYLLDNFLPSYKDFDIIKGWRADDSYFSFTRAFLENSITFDQLSRAMHLGKLGEQVVLKGKAAFDLVEFGGAFPVERSVYFPRKIARDRKAREDFREILNEPAGADDIYMIDILRQNWRNDDERLR